MPIPEMYRVAPSVNPFETKEDCVERVFKIRKLGIDNQVS
jgi:hypothetical protein